MKREKKLTKRERKALAGNRPAAPHAHGHAHIHCIACGRHLDEHEFDTPATATWIVCQHKSSFPACVGCRTPAQELVDAHDRSGQPVRSAPAYH